MVEKNSIIEQNLSGKQRRLLQTLLAEGSHEAVYIIDKQQSELAQQLKISRQGLSMHLRRLRDGGYIRTGRGFIIVTEKGVSSLGKSSNPAFIFIRISPLKREASYREIVKLKIERIYRVAGDMDALLIVERDQLDEILLKLTSVDGIQNTKSFVVIKTIK